MTPVVPCLDNIFMVLLISELAKVGMTKPIFLGSGSPGWEGGGSCVCWHGLLSLYSSYTKFKGKTLFSLSLTAIVQSYAAKLLEDIFFCFVPN